MAVVVAVADSRSDAVSDLCVAQRSDGTSQRWPPTVVRSIAGTVLSQYCKYFTINKQRLRLLLHRLGTMLRQQFYNLVMPPMRPQLGRGIARYVVRIDVCAVLQ
jgi:hypothetical protein